MIKLQRSQVVPANFQKSTTSSDLEIRQSWLFVVEKKSPEAENYWEELQIEKRKVGNWKNSVVGRSQWNNLQK